MKRSLQVLSERWPNAVDIAGAIALGAAVLTVLLALAVAVVPAEVPAPQALASGTPTPAADPTPPAPAPPSTDTVVTDTSVVLVLETGSRLYPDWKEERRVHLGEEFALGDTDNSAVATKLLPDFRIIDGKPMSLSADMTNPAARILVRQNGAAVDSSWAFLNFPPHFSPRSFFTFKIKEIAGYPAGKPAATSPGTVTVGRE